MALTLEFASYHDSHSYLSHGSLTWPSHPLRADQSLGGHLNYFLAVRMKEPPDQFLFYTMGEAPASQGCLPDDQLFKRDCI